MMRPRLIFRRESALYMKRWLPGVENIQLTEGVPETESPLSPAFGLARMLSR